MVDDAELLDLVELEVRELLLSKYTTSQATTIPIIKWKCFEGAAKAT